MTVPGLVHTCCDQHLQTSVWPDFGTGSVHSRPCHNDVVDATSAHGGQTLDKPAWHLREVSIPFFNLVRIQGFAANPVKGTLAASWLS